MVESAAAAAVGAGFLAGICGGRVEVEIAGAGVEDYDLFLGRGADGY